MEKLCVKRYNHAFFIEKQFYYMFMDQFIETKYKAYRERRVYRIKTATIFIICWILYGLVGFWVQLNMQWFFSLFVVISCLGFLGSLILVGTYKWIYESVETIIFVNLYKALNYLQLFSEKEEESQLYLGKAAKHLKNAISELATLSTPEKVRSVLFDKEFSDRLETLIENLQKRVLPRISQGSDIERMRSVLRGLAQFFGETAVPISLSGIDSINENLQRLEEIPFEEISVQVTLKSMVLSTPGRIVLSFFVGFVSVYSIIFVHCQLFDVEFVDLVRGNLVNIISVATVVSGIIAGALILKK